MSRVCAGDLTQLSELPQLLCVYHLLFRKQRLGERGGRETQHPARHCSEGIELAQDKTVTLACQDVSTWRKGQTQ